MLPVPRSFSRSNFSVRSTQANTTSPTNDFKKLSVRIGHIVYLLAGRVGQPYRRQRASWLPSSARHPMVWIPGKKHERTVGRTKTTWCALSFILHTNSSGVYISSAYWAGLVFSRALSARYPCSMREFRIREISSTKFLLFS